LVGEGVELVDHRVDGVLELEDLALDVDGDLFGEVSVGDRGADLGDVADLAGQVAGHQVHVLGQVFPDAAHALHLRLAAQLALGAHLASDARHLGGEQAQLVDQRVDGLGGLEELALEAPAVDLHRHRLNEVAAGDRTDDLAHLRIRPGEVLDQVVDGVQRGGPSTARVTKGRALDLALFADALAEPLELALEPLVRFDDLVESGRHAARGPCPIRGHPSREVTALDGAEDVERDARIHRVGDYDPAGHEMRLLSRDWFWCCTLRAAASASGRGARSQAPRPWIWRSYAV